MIGVKTGLAPEWHCFDEKETSDSERFEITPLDQIEYLNIMAQFSPITVQIRGDGIFEALSNGLTNWRNVKDENGVVIEFSVPNIRKLNHRFLTKAFNKVMEVSRLDEDEEKN